MLVYNENGYNLGNYMDNFWQKAQKWKTGWRVVMRK
jgi:hypothetical protein